ncbi:pseudouridine synthase [Marinomonas ostreistagni]|uniref:pseudouridine synthase n=1 Tax=Marinomonas ostreistagni TaxID=359209 RepID=UPI00194F91D6|nr:pseudouridine synthase [Marinomonas ostreistagni]MBM6549833.1 RNA pseudouridine synthase [Marinomonas ostreistagni]
MTPIHVLYQHADFWLVYKPAGESFHSEQGVGFAQRLQAEYPEQTFFPVHRLDKLTSGLLLFATHKTAAAEFGRLFSEHRLEKRYLAVSDQKPKKKQGTISGAMTPSRRGQWRLTQQGEALAVTQFFSFALDGKRYFYIRPLTGKTHQIRVALKSFGAPILGDERYGAHAADRGYLHAYSLEFEWHNETFAFKAWPEEGDGFSAAAQAQYQTLFFDGSLTWPKFTLPNRNT